jgi:hypothetical protein
MSARKIIRTGKDKWEPGKHGKIVVWARPVGPGEFERQNAWLYEDKLWIQSETPYMYTPVEREPGDQLEEWMEPKTTKLERKWLKRRQKNPAAGTVYIYDSERGVTEKKASLVVGDLAAVETKFPSGAKGGYANITWIPTGLAIRSDMKPSQAKDAVRFFGGTARGRRILDHFISNITKRGSKPVGWGIEFSKELQKTHPSGSETPYKEPSVKATTYEVEALVPSGRELLQIQDEETAMALAVGYEAKAGKAEPGDFVRITRIEPPSKRTLLWWAMWDQDGWRTMHKDPSLPFDPDALQVESHA